MTLTAASYVGGIMLVGGAVALLERRLVGFRGLWILPVLGLAAPYFGFRLGNGPCGNIDVGIAILLLLVLGGYVVACTIQQVRGILRGAA
jgi:hypothetical protein